MRRTDLWLPLLLVAAAVAGDETVATSPPAPSIPVPAAASGTPGPSGGLAGAGRGRAAGASEATGAPPARAAEREGPFGSIESQLSHADVAKAQLLNDFSELLLELQAHGLDKLPAGVPMNIKLLQNDLAVLSTMMNDTRVALSNARYATGKQAAELRELQEREEEARLKRLIREGEAKVDYRTGTFRTLDQGSASQAGASAGPSGADQAKLHQLAEELAEESDPAVLHLDVQFLQDFVVLVVSGAAGGVLINAIGRLPSSLGFIFGGMLVGPSGMDVVQNIVSVQTLSQVGAVFLLFLHGLGYAKDYSARWDRVLRSSMQETCLIMVASTFIVGGTLLMGGIVKTWGQALLFALATTFSSSALVGDGIEMTALGASAERFTVQAILACQDLLMVPTLSLPVVIAALGREDDIIDPAAQLLRECFAVACAGVVILVLSRYLLPLVVTRLQQRRSGGRKPDDQVDGGAQGSRGEETRAGALPDDASRRQEAGELLETGGDMGHISLGGKQLLTISLAAYALLVSLMGERIGISPEAGALLAGLAINDPKTISVAMNAAQPLTSLFGGLYLASLGMLVSPGFIISYLHEVLWVVAVVFVVKMALVFTAMRRFGMKRPMALNAALICSQVSELCLFFVSRAERHELVSRHAYLTFLASTVLFQGLAPLIISVAANLNGRAPDAGGRDGARAGKGMGLLTV